MTTFSVSMKPRKIRWDEDEDDDWDMETYLKTTNNSAPKVSDLVSLHIPPSAEEVEFVVEQIVNKRKLQVTPADCRNDDADDDDEDAYEDEDDTSALGPIILFDEQYYQDDAGSDNAER